MNAKATVVLAFAAGLAGGIVSQHLNTPVYAQALPGDAKEIRAQRFIVVDENGVPRGAFGIGTKENLPAVEVTDKKGNAWSARFTENGLFKHKRSLVPPK